MYNGKFSFGKLHKSVYGKFGFGIYGKFALIHTENHSIGKFRLYT